MDHVTDPVCGMRIDPASAHTRLVHAGHTDHFCSAECVQRFEADPVRYGRRDDTMDEPGDEPAMERHEPPYTTFGGITVPKFGSAGSGGLEHELLPEAHDHDSDASR